MKTPYEQSQDYQSLIDLIEQGYFIVGFIDFYLFANNKREIPKKDVVVIKKEEGQYVISNRVLGVNSPTKEEFLNSCKVNNLSYIKPNLQYADSTNPNP